MSVDVLLAEAPIEQVSVGGSGAVAVFADCGSEKNIRLTLFVGDEKVVEGEATISINDIDTLSNALLALKQRCIFRTVD